MKVLVVNPPYQTFTCNVGVGHQTPLGLLMVAGPLVDAGHDVRFLDAEAEHLSLGQVAERAAALKPGCVLTGHAGSTPGHQSCVATLEAVKAALPEATTVYGGVHPTFHAEATLEQHPAIDIIVRGEGEATATELIAAIESGADLAGVLGLSIRRDGGVVETLDRPPILDLDSYRVGWELIEDWDRYQCFGLGRAAVTQFSRGCPHHCTFCGQRRFWQTWRHRTPGRVADEVEWLHREHRVNFVHLADDNPATDPDVWHEFLREMASRDLPVRFYTTIRASDICRDAEALPLYQQAGVLYVLMGIESTDPDTLDRVSKGETVEQDRRACGLLRENGMFSVMAYLVGFGEETWAGIQGALGRIRAYKPDWLNVLHVTPHAWTEFTEQESGRAIIEPELSRWDYRHQVLAEKHMKPWQMHLAVKLLEARFHMSPGRLWRIMRMRDKFLRRQLWWSLRHTSPVWIAENLQWIGDVVRPRGKRRRAP